MRRPGARRQPRRRRPPHPRQQRGSVPDHLLHRPGGGGLTREEVEGVGYAWRPLPAELDRLGVTAATATGERVDRDGAPFFHIANPALGLWIELPLEAVDDQVSRRDRIVSLDVPVPRPASTGSPRPHAPPRRPARSRARDVARVERPPDPQVVASRNSAWSAHTPSTTMTPTEAPPGLLQGPSHLPGIRAVLDRFRVQDALDDLGRSPASSNPADPELVGAHELRAGTERASDRLP